MPDTKDEALERVCQELRRVEELFQKWTQYRLDISAYLEKILEHYSDLQQELELTKGQLFAKDHSERNLRNAINELVGEISPLVAELDDKNKVLEWYATEENYDRPLIGEFGKRFAAASVVQKDGGNKALEVLLHYKEGSK